MRIDSPVGSGIPPSAFTTNCSSKEVIVRIPSSSRPRSRRRLGVAIVAVVAVAATLIATGLATPKRSSLTGTPITVFNGGDMVRDFTYVDDIVEGVVRVIDRPAAPDAAWSGDSPDPATSRAPYRIFNIGNNRPVNLMRYIEVLEECLGRKAQLEMLPMQPGDVQATFADVTELGNATGFWPCTPVEEGIAKFVAWYRDYYGVDHDRAPSTGSA